MTNLFAVEVDFPTSHLIFPRLMIGLLVILGVAILITQRRPILGALGRRPFWPAGIDRLRFFGTLVLILAYFFALPAVGNIFPNTGLGFLFCSMPFVFALSLLFLHERTARAILGALISAVVAPLAVWFILSRIFGITLP